MICPEESLVKYVQKLIDYPEALQVLEFSEGRALLIAVRAAHGSLVVDHTIAELRQLFPAAPMRLVALYREERADHLRGRHAHPGGRRDLPAGRRGPNPPVLRAMHPSGAAVRRLMIAGGGKVGLRLARRLAGQYEVKVIERELKRCEYLSGQLPSTLLVLQGDCTDEELLADENVDDMDMFLSLTSDDEDNILAAMLAKRLGAKRVLALINRRAYGDLIQGSTIDIALSPAHTVIGEPAAAARRRGGGEQPRARCRRGFKASPAAMPVPPNGPAGRPACAAPGVSIGAIVRGDGPERKVLMPHHDTVIETDDRLVMFIPHKRQVREVERLFQVSATFF